MTLAPPRATGRPLIETRPLRHPDAADPGLMAKRGWWLVVLNLLVPGSAQILAGNRRLGRFGLGATLLAWFLAIVAAGLALFARPVLLWLTIGGGWFSAVVLTLVQILLVAYVVLWIVLTFDALRLVRLVKVPRASRLAIPVVALVLLGLVGGAAGYAATAVGSARNTISSIFGLSGPSVEPSEGYYNILLLGADSGDGRDSLRYDSISVVSVNADTGAVTITGIPRELPHAPFSEGSPMQALYPNGFEGQSSSTCGWNGWMNHVRNAAEVCREDGGAELYPDAASHGSSPGIEATKDAAEGVLGIEIPYYVFVDMHGFAEVVDALGGVDINVTERLPKGGPPDGWTGTDVNEWAIGWIEPGQQHMDGDTAQWYARSRYTTSDWDRMERQRELQEAILAQFTPQTVLTRFNEVAAAGTALIDTDLPQDKLPEFFDLMLDAKKQPVTTIELTPANGVDEHQPDYAVVHEMIQQALHPPTETPAPEQ
ncbi:MULTISPECIES: LCP family protein [unclassified Microbacterium]|uniref:LCP family protein n=1 Tax=unclassified Microbacterium TaxID=2609290 RepID=UPI000EAAA594|nr:MULTISPECIES: LCP family protein [unclassified Microbacterium]MBT2485374.1 LCP family protein [Microbacterium sp. ISL-108]RKN68177.1 LytR family transcriptional regulator [Microbacterium sp. CGR2]